ncbi:MAG: tetratricopeptide repeat protein [Acidobacteriota bacterium]
MPDRCTKLICRIPLLALSGVLLALWLQAQTPADWRRRMEIITGHLSHSRVPEAEQEINRMLEIYPESAPVHNLLGICRMQRGALDQAIRSFERALELDASLIQARFNLGLLCLQSGRFPAAVQHLQRVVDAEPSKAENYLPLIDATLKAGDQRAATALVHKLKALPDLASATRFRLAALLHENGLNRLALEDARAAAQAAPDRIEPVLLWASILFALDDCREAIRVVEASPEKMASAAGLQGILGSCYGKLGLHQKAIPALEASLRLQPGHPRVYFDLANQYQQIGELRKAHEVLKQVSGKFPESQEVRHESARVWLALVAKALKQGESAVAREGLEAVDPAARTVEEYQLLSANLLQVEDRNAEAMAFLEKLEATYGQSPRFVFTMGLSRYNLGQYREALDLFQKALRLDAKFHQAMHYSGQCYANLEDYSAAARCQREAIKMNPSEHTYHFYLGWVLLRLGLSQEAEEQFQEAVRLAPSYAPAHYELGKLLLDQDKVPQAIARLTQAIEADPLFDQSYYQLSRAYRKAGDSAQAAVYLSRFQEAKRQERERAVKRKEAIAILP